MLVVVYPFVFVYPVKYNYNNSIVTLIITPIRLEFYYCLYKNNKYLNFMISLKNNPHFRNLTIICTLWDFI